MSVPGEGHEDVLNREQDDRGHGCYAALNCGVISIFTTKIRVRKSNHLDSVLKSKISAVLSGEAVTMFPQLARFSDFGFLLLRLMVGVVFITSGWNDLKDPEKRSKSLGFGKGFTIFLGVAEVAGSLGIMFGS